jgi:hypothetical protein
MRRRGYSCTDIREDAAPQDVGRPLSWKSQEIPTTMKKLFSSALLALAVSGFAASPSFAWTFGLFPHSCGCCGCGAKFCVRQYNAFSPVCCGTICCDGCCPFGGGGMGGGCGPCADGMCGDGMCCPGGSCGLNFSGVPSCPSSCCGGGCADGACLGSLPAAESVAPDGAAPPASNPVVGPSPLPGSMPAGPTSQAVGYRGIQNTSYRPPVAPAARSVPPARMQPQMMAAPSYWDN